MKHLTKISDRNYKLKGQSHPFFGNQHTRIIRKSQSGEISAKTMIKLGFLFAVILVAIIAALLVKKPSKIKLLNPCAPMGCASLIAPKAYAAVIKTTITYGATPTQTPVLSVEEKHKEYILSKRHGDILIRIWSNETSRGHYTKLDPTNLQQYCEARNETNQFGYGANLKLCFSTFKDSVDTVDTWFDKHLQTMSLEDALLLYSGGSKNYVASFLAQSNK